MRTKVILGVVALLGGAAFAVAQTSHSGHVDGMDHTMHGQDHAMHAQDQTIPRQSLAAPRLTEPGQGAFAALAEVVSVLEADPETDWSKVDLIGLRAHLVDMDRVISDSVVTQTMLPDGMSAVATGDAATVASLLRMVPAHSAMLARDDRWTVTAAEAENGVSLRVTSTDPAVVARIQGLGFFGLMASQDHHREHHMMMALGQDAHAH